MEPVWNACRHSCSILAGRRACGINVGIRPHSIQFKVLTVSNSFDNNKDNGGKSFRDFPKDWEGSLMDDFGKWSTECFGKGAFRQV